jgi:hypothetical protein
VFKGFAAYVHARDPPPVSPPPLQCYLSIHFTVSIHWLSMIGLECEAKSFTVTVEYQLCRLALKASLAGFRPLQGSKPA